jgi:hypothetical protein
MAQTIKIKRSTGTAAPATLAQGELAYSKGSDTFYVGDPAAANTPIPIGGAIKNNAGTPVLATGITAAEIRTLIDVDLAGTDNSTDQNIWYTITADTGTTSANTTTDSLAIEGGTGITTSISGDTLTITNSAAAGTLDDLSDVTITSVADNELLAYNSGTSEWINQTPAEAGFATVATSGAYSDLSGTPTIPAAAANATITLSAGTDLTTGGDFTTNQSANETITFNHADITRTNTTTGTASPSYGGTFTAIGSITTNARGHVTAVDTKTITLPASDNTDVDVSDANLKTRLAALDSATIGDGTGTITVSGNLTVSGTTTTVNTETINLADNIITLNSNSAATPTENAGIEVERGSATNTALRWNEGTDRWEFTNDGSTYNNIPLPSEYATGDITGVTAGVGLSGGGASGDVSLALDFSELTDMTGSISGTTEFILQNGTTESRKAASEIILSAFNNDSGWTSNTGTVTSVAISSTDASITGTGTITTAGTFDLQVGTIDGGTY